MAENLRKCEWVHERGSQEAAQAQIGGQNDLKIIRLMKCVLVVFCMAGPEHDVAAPSEKGEQAKEELV